MSTKKSSKIRRMTWRSACSLVKISLPKPRSSLKRRRTTSKFIEKSLFRMRTRLRNSRKSFKKL